LTRQKRVQSFSDTLYISQHIFSTQLELNVPEQAAEAVVAGIKQVIAVHHAQESHAVTFLLVQPISRLLHMLGPHVRVIHVAGSTGILPHHTATSDPSKLTFVSYHFQHLM
jgi:hypothetical protein